MFFVLAALLNGLLAIFSQGSFDETKLISLLLSFAMGPMLVGAGIYCTVKGYGPAIYFSVAWTCVIAGNSLVLLANIGVLEKTLVTSWSQLIGANLEMLLLSFALGARINLIKAAL